jgi:hypothetical protein
MGCGVPADDFVRSEFLARYPSYSVIFVGVGEGDGDHAYFHILYKKPDDLRTFEQVWLYQDRGGSEWELIHRTSETVYTLQ